MKMKRKPFAIFRDGLARSDGGPRLVFILNAARATLLAMAIASAGLATISCGGGDADEEVSSPASGPPGQAPAAEQAEFRPIETPVPGPLDVEKIRASIGLAEVIQSDESPPGVSLKLTYGPDSQTVPTAISVMGLDRAKTTTLRAGQELGHVDWDKVFPVRVVPDKDQAGAEPTPVVGDYEIGAVEPGSADEALTFTPRYPFSPGVTYRAVFDLRARPFFGIDRLGNEAVTEYMPIEFEFTAPEPEVSSTAEVEAVYPSSSLLPENTLKFYVHFSAAMTRGVAYEHIALVDAEGEEVFSPFLELPEELWDPEGRRFTLFFDPGRIKRGLVPHDELGLALEAGQIYSLRISADWPDEHGAPMIAGFEKTFQATPPDDVPLDPDNWTIAAPAAGSLEPVRVSFPEPVDRALLDRMLWIESVNAGELAGEIAVAKEETRWSFTPRAPWAAGGFRLVAQTMLEDRAGNGIGRAFEVDLFERVEDQVYQETVFIPFDISPAG